MASPENIIATTFSMDQADMKDARYQPTRTMRAIFVIGNDYYAVGKKKPADEVGQPWQPYKDQWYAERHGTVLWESKMLVPEK